MGTPYIAFQVLENLESKCELGEAPGKVFSLSPLEHMERMKMPSQESAANFLNSKPLIKTTVCPPS